MVDPLENIPPSLSYAGAYQKGMMIGHINHVSPLQVTGIPSATLAPTDSLAGGKGTKKGRPKASVEELAAARKAKQRVTARVAKAVDYYMDQAYRTSVVVPWIYVYVTGSLGAASALSQIQAESEWNLHENNSPWVSKEPEFWYRRTGLNQDGWIEARQQLRECGLIEERSRFDPRLGGIVTEIQWLPEVYCAACAEVRADIRADLRQAIERGLDIGPGL